MSVRPNSGTSGTAPLRHRFLSGFASTGSKSSPCRSCGLVLDILYGVIDNLMDEFWIQTLIGLQGVRENLRSRFDMRLDVSLERLFLAAVDYVGTDLAATLEDANHHRFVAAASPGDLFRFEVFVHVACLAADECLVNFDLSSDLLKRASLHCQPDALKHEPSGFLCHTDSPRKFP